MARHYKSGPSGQRETRGADAPRVTIYAEVTDRIISELEAGRVPWVQPWSNAVASPALPANAVTGRPYSGINILFLWGAVIAHGFASQRWLTFAQARDAGGMVRKGEHGTQVVFANRFTPKDAAGRNGGSRADNGGRANGDSRAGGRDALAGGEAAKAIPFLKRFTVFNVEQIDGLPDDLTHIEVLPPHEIMPAAEALVAASGADIRIGGSEAYYLPSRDIVQLPPPHAFASISDFYATTFHELGHWTGGRTRLDRPMNHGFASPDYAREELIAELTSAFLCASLGLAPTVRHADYIADWLDLLRTDARAIFRAASAATKAAEWLRDRHRMTQNDAERDIEDAERDIEDEGAAS
jgi:antirestriction protein ArdC